jgi:serine/threonine-protein kinase
MDPLTNAVTMGVTTVTPPPVTPTSTRFAPGAIVAGRYRLVALLGRGGMGEVYRADDLTLDQTVALKFLPEGIAGGDLRLAQFHNELRTARQVSHRNVCRLYDLGDADGRRFLTMEYVDGEDLASLLRRIGRIPQDKAIQIARQLCAGVAAAHERGVLHRDLKPANVMLRADGSLCLIDFGLAKANEMEVSLTGSREIFGTPYYMSPEQGHAEEIDGRSDLYSLGVMFYEMLIGHKPYTGATAMEVIYKHKRAELPEIAPQFAEYQDILQRLLAKSPADRYQSAGALLEAISALKIPA